MTTPTPPPARAIFDMNGERLVVVERGDAYALHIHTGMPDGGFQSIVEVGKDYMMIERSLGPPMRGLVAWIPAETR